MMPHKWTERELWLIVSTGKCKNQPVRLSTASGNSTLLLEMITWICHFLPAQV